MATINIRVRSQGANTSITELQRLQAIAQSTARATVQLAQQLNTTFSQAQRFAQSLGLTSQQATQAVSSLRGLQSVGANTGQQFIALRRQLGLTREQFIQLRRSVEEFDERLSINNVQLGTIAVGLGRIAVGLRDVGEESTRTFVNLEQALNEFEAISGATGDSLASVEEQIRDLGNTSANTATNVATAAISLARLGFTAEEVDNILPAVNAAAIATSESIDTLSRVLGNVVNQFQLAGEGEARFLEITDQLVFVANNSATNVESLGEALSFVGPSANNAGQSVETVLGVLGLFANAGITASRAGIALSNVLTRLRNAAAEQEDPTNAAAQAFARLGISITDQTGQLREFDESLLEILDALRSIEDVGERGLIIQDLFGIRQGRDFNALLNLTNEEITQFIENLELAEGTAQQASETILQGLTGQIELLESASEAAQITIGENLAVAVEPVLALATQLLQTFADLPAPIQATLVAIGSFTTALVAAVAAVSALTLAERTLRVTQTIRTGATIAGNAATTAADLLSKRLTLSLIAQAATERASAAVTTARALATGTATAATRASIVALGTLAGIIAGITLSVGLLVNEYNSLNRAANQVREGTARIEEELAIAQSELDSVRSSTRGASEDFEGFAVTAAQNLERLRNDLGTVTNVLDGFRAKFEEVANLFTEGELGSRTALEVATDRQTIAFSEQLEQIGEVIDANLNLLNIQRESADVNLEATQRGLEALIRTRNELSRQAPATESAIQAQQIYLTTLDRSINTIQDFIDANSESTESFIEVNEATEEQIATLDEYTQALEEAEANARRAATEISTAETQRLIEVEQLLQDSVIDAREAEELRLEATLSRIREELEAEQEKIDALTDIVIEEGELVRRNEDEINRARQRSLDLTLELLETEREAEEATIEAIARNRENLFERIASGLSRISQINQDAAQIGQDINDATERLVNLELDDLRRALQIRVELDTEDLTDNERLDLEQELADLGVSRRTSENALLNRIRNGERELAEIRRQSLDEEQRRQEELLAIEQRKLEIDLRRAEIAARRAQIEAREQVAQTEAQITEAETEEELDAANELNSLANDALTLANEELDLINQQIAGLDQVIERQRTRLELNQAIADTELESEAAAARQENLRGISEFEDAGRGRFRQISTPNITNQINVPTINPVITPAANTTQVIQAPASDSNTEVLRTLNEINRNLQENLRNGRANTNLTVNNTIQRTSDRDLLNQVTNQLEDVFRDIRINDGL